MTRVALALAFAMVVSSAMAQGTVIDTRHGPDRVQTFIVPQGNGITVIPPSPPGTIVICGGIDCQVVPVPPAQPARR